MDVVIADSTCTYMVQQTSTTITHVAMMVVEEKTRSYAERAQGDDFIPLDIETYECFHSYFDSFFIVCAQTIIARHQQSSLFPLMLISYY